jgi:hypothetical protein
MGRKEQGLPILDRLKGFLKYVLVAVMFYLLLLIAGVNDAQGLQGAELHGHSHASQVWTLPCFRYVA